MASANTPLLAHLAARFPVLAIAEVVNDTAVACSAAAIQASLEAKDIQVVVARSLDDRETAISSDIRTAPRPERWMRLADRGSAEPWS
jgi:penicillin V acylase-like amidase (Ntn superfamily)